MFTKRLLKMRCDKKCSNRFYFTFGANPQFPYGSSEYVEVIAPDKFTACRAFSINYPDRHKGIMNCAFVYNGDEFKGIKKKYYSNKQPSDILDYSKLFKFRVGERIIIKRTKTLGTVTAISPGSCTVLSDKGETYSIRNSAAQKCYKKPLNKCGEIERNEIEPEKD